MDRKYIAIRFEDDRGWIEVRLESNGSIGCHWKAFDGQRYMNSPTVCENGQLDEAYLKSFCARAWGSDPEQVKGAIEELQALAQKGKGE